MDRKKFQDWLAGVDNLSHAQRTEALAVLSGQPDSVLSLAAIEASVEEDRRCPHCGTPDAVSRGKARGLRRYQCKGCKRTFNAATGTPLSGLHRKERWLSFGMSLAEGETVRESARRCGLGVNTAFRWRHRFLEAAGQDRPKLKGIVEVDETYVLESHKGSRTLDRKARKRGGKASKRGLSDEQVPVLVTDIVLVSDGHGSYPPCAAAMGVRHEALNLSAGERVRDAFHIQTVNSVGRQFILTVRRQLPLRGGNSLSSSIFRQQLAEKDDELSRKRGTDSDGCIVETGAFPERSGAASRGYGGHGSISSQAPIGGRVGW